MKKQDLVETIVKEANNLLAENQKMFDEAYKPALKELEELRKQEKQIESALEEMKRIYDMNVSKIAKERDEAIALIPDDEPTANDSEESSDVNELMNVITEFISFIEEEDKKSHKLDKECKDLIGDIKNLLNA